MTKISVILPNYNHSKYIINSVNNLVKQSEFIKELIIIDDCSKDKSRVLLQTFEKDPLIKIIYNKKNIGTINCQNLGLSLVTGEYVFFAAADDFILPGFFYKAIKHMTVNPHHNLFTGDTILINEKSNIIGIRPRMCPKISKGFINKINTDKLYTKIDNFILTGASIIKKSVFDDMGFLDPSLESYADGYYLKKISLNYGFYYFPFPVTTWRHYKNSFSKKNSMKKKKNDELIGRYTKKMELNGLFSKKYINIFKTRIQFQTQILKYEFEYDRQSKTILTYYIKSIVLFLKLKPISFIQLIMNLFIYIYKYGHYKFYYNKLIPKKH